ncbi:uncharacterized protein C3H1.02c-like [Xenia sp. Carnegie-2017]|uniref:uncharacterized protein C3H1.02c-like n=1 Tax=Xenia sp. Carnegie-2017 TaxID=2897299 RepID=UPI001F04BCB0|nr:uncharacterized protein C3H1.02c-like [Xenia sp. Carnegie-2017]
MACNVNTLPEKASEIWETEFIPNSCPYKAQLQLENVQNVRVFLRENVGSKIIGVGSVESSFLIQCCRCIQSYTDPDFPAILVFIECLTALEGPMWRTIRELGLSYHYSMHCDPEEGLMYFILKVQAILFKASHPVKAYEKAKEIMDGYVTGAVSFEIVQLESAISSVMFEVICQESVGNFAYEVT